MKLIPWHKDKWLSCQGTLLPWDKIEHLLLAFIGLYATSHLGMALKWALPLWLAIGFLYEVKDGYLSHGFSIKDMLANIAGFLLAILIG